MTERWHGIKRNYTTEDVKRLQPSVIQKHTLAERGANKLWNMLRQNNRTAALGALTGNQAVQSVRAGLKAIYVSGWQVAADANLANTMYPDQSLYPVNSVPTLVQKINNALTRADQVDKLKNGESEIDWYAPIVADAEAGFGGNLNAFELMKSMIESGAAGIHFEDQLASEKKCGHLGGKVLVPTGHFVRTLTAARLAADVLEVPTVLIARTDADSAKLITSDIDPYDAQFITGERTPEGFFHLGGTGLDRSIARGLAYAPYADLLWMETSKPNLDQAKAFADAIHEKFPGKMLAYNCSPSFNWRQHLSEEELKQFQAELNNMGYKFQFVTLAGWHSLNFGMFQLASEYKETGMFAYSNLQNREFDAEQSGYTAVKHQQEVGTGYFDAVATTISGGESSTVALKESTEAEQF
jgi:isocitrate lyase